MIWPLPAPHGIADLLTRHAVAALADKAYQASRTHHGRTVQGQTSVSHQKAVNRSIAKAPALGERAAATLTCRKILTKPRCCPRLATPILATITVIQHVEDRRRSR
ncbi:MAG TPA: hypothetical protein VFC19_06585 [Candidatus Limnocylindrales bacterium]|nr:hypothetical protein [Candidatus Limnocylindrales bacterium]